ncbi:hypothetical protein VNO77_18498 [Canavalia gladiata]|uniref:Uncharacterized protein n=1 Tax=Canavalia gladiata TaxID=3824 RepID=A0AAN9QJP9_CANGL
MCLKGSCDALIVFYVSYLIGPRHSPSTNEQLNCKLWNGKNAKVVLIFGCCCRWCLIREEFMSLANGYSSDKIKANFGRDMMAMPSRLMPPQATAFSILESLDSPSHGRN